MAPLEVFVSEERIELGDDMLTNGHDDDHDNGPVADFSFEPEPEKLLGALLPKYVSTRIFSSLLDAAASESAARRTAMKAATDNANELVNTLSRQATRLARPRSPRKSARSSAAPTRSPRAQEVTST